MRSLNTNGVAVDYSYDELNRLKTVTDATPSNPSATSPRPGTGSTSYSYDMVGNLAGYVYPNGVQTAYTYNTLNRLTNMSAVNGQQSALSSFTYELGAAGNRLSVTELNGRKASYGYDNLYRLTSEEITGDQVAVNNGSISYVYDAVGNRLSRTSTLAAIPSTTSTFDANDRLNSDQYDANGSTIGSGANTYRYDFENHLITLNAGSPNVVSYLYDGDGNRVSKTVGTGGSAVTTKFLVDSMNPTGYAQVVEEVVGAIVQRSYVHGHSLINQTQLIGPPTATWVRSFYGMDGHSSVRFLTDTSGAITDTYTYDAFGNLIAQTGTTPNNYLYVGEQLDGNLGFYYLRARYMNPSSGRFWSIDPFEGIIWDPLSLHKYTYANGDGVNRSDPSGEFVGVAEVSVAEADEAIISSISVPIWKKVIAGVIIALLVAGVVAGTGTVFEDPHQPRLNSMRVQLQEGDNHITSKVRYNTDPPGVTVAQMRRALEELFLEGRDLIPGRLESAFLGTIARTSIGLGQFPPGGVIHGDNVWRERFFDRGKVYRVDTENRFGHNLRQ